MQHVKISWLRILNYSLVGVTGILFVTHFLFNHFGVSQAVKDHWGITPLILIIGAIHAIYVFISDRLTIRRFPWFTTLGSVTIFAFLCVSIIETSGNTNIAYRALFTFVIFSAAMIDIFTPVVAVLFSWTALIFTSAGILTPTKSSLLFNIVADTLLTIAALCGWSIFKRYYVKTENKEAEQLENTLEQEQFKASIILESITDGVMIMSAAGVVQLINKSAAHILGWSQDDARNLNYHVLLQPIEEGNTSQQEPPETAIDSCITTGKATQKVGLFKTKSRESVYLDIVASPILSPDTISQTPTTLGGIIAVFRDVSMVRAEERRRADFISTASHEMRTPVAAIEGYLALALNGKLATIDEKARIYLQKAHQNTQHLGELFQDLLTTTNAEDGRLVNHPEVVEMSAYLEQLANDFRFVAEKKNLKMNFSIGDTSGNKVIKPLYYTFVDPLRIHEVITNLFDNAVKYTPTGTITLGLTGDQNIVQCFIRDSGQGIPAEDINHLFQKFFRVDSSETRTIGGTGLGLFICRKIIEMYHGRIWVESTIGQGSTFYFNLPRLSSQQVAARQASSSSAHPTQITPTAEPVTAAKAENSLASSSG